MRTWEALADGLLDAAILVRIEHSQRPAEQQSLAWAERQMGKVYAALAAMSSGLADKNWCNGHAYTIADIAVGCALGYLDFRFAGNHWRATYPNLERFYERLMARPQFADTAPPAA